MGFLCEGGCKFDRRNCKCGGEDTPKRKSSVQKPVDRQTPNLKPSKIETKCIRREEGSSLLVIFNVTTNCRIVIQPD